MKRKITALLLIFTLLFSCTSCSLLLTQEKDKTADGITRGKFVREVALAYGYDEDFADGSYSFDDIEDHPYGTYIEYGARKGFFESYYSPHFNPDEIITRDFAALVAANCVDFVSEERIECEDWNSIYYNKHAKTAVDLGILSLEDGKFNPKDGLSVDDMEKVVSFVGYARPTFEEIGKNHESLEYQDGVTVLDIEVAEPVDGVLTLPIYEELRELAVGEILVIEGDAAYEIKSIERLDDAYRVQVDTPEIQKVFKRIQIGGASTVDVSAVKPIGNVVINKSPAVACDSEGSITTKLPSVPLDLTVPLGKCDLNVTIKLSDIALHYKWDVDFEGKLPQVNNAYLVLEKTTDAKIAIATPDKDKTNLLGADIPSSIPLLTIPFAGTKNFGCVVEVSLVLNASGSFEIEFTVVDKNGLKILNNLPRIVDSTDCTMDGMKLAGEVSAGLEFDIKAEVLNFDLTSFKIEAGYKLGGELDFKYADFEHPEDNFFCLDVSYSPYATLTLFEDTLIEKWLKMKLSWDILNDDDDDDNESLHIENFSSIVPDCTYDPTTHIQFSVVDLISGGVTTMNESPYGPGHHNHSYSYGNFRTKVEIHVVYPGGGYTIYEEQFIGTSVSVTINIYDYVSYYDECHIDIDVIADRIWEHCNICCGANNPNGGVCNCDPYLLEESEPYSGTFADINEHMTYDLQAPPYRNIILFDDPDAYWEEVAPK